MERKKRRLSKRHLFKDPQHPLPNVSERRTQRLSPGKNSAVEKGKRAKYAHRHKKTFSKIYFWPTSAFDDTKSLSKLAPKAKQTRQKNLIVLPNAPDGWLPGNTTGKPEREKSNLICRDLSILSIGAGFGPGQARPHLRMRQQAKKRHPKQPENQTNHVVAMRWGKMTQFRGFLRKAGCPTSQRT